MMKRTPFICLPLMLILGVSAIGQVKPPIKGLLDRNRMPPAALHPYFGGFVVNAYWKELQPSFDGLLADNNVIDQAIRQIRQTPSANHMKLKIRIFSGQYAPEWVKNLGEGPVYVGDKYDGVGAKAVPRWWEDEYQAKYASLLEQLSARYDTVPEVAEFTISGCMTIYAEPLLRSVALESNRVNLLRAGYTANKDMTAQRKTIRAHRVFRQTHSSIALNPYQYVTEEGEGVISLDSTVALLNEAYEVLRGKIVLGNNSLRIPLSYLGPKYASMYAAMFAKNTNVYFQTATPERVGDLAATLQWAIDSGVNYVELPYGYKDHNGPLTSAQLEEYNRGLLASPTDPRGTTVADFSTSTDSMCVGEVFQLRGWTSTGAQSFAWEYPGGTLVEDRWHPYVRYASPGTYEVTLIATGEYDGDTLKKEITIQDCTEGGLQVAPNPFTNNCSVVVHHSEEVPMEVVVYDADNRRVYHGTGHRTNQRFYLGERWLPGTYVVEVAYAAQRKTVRVVKQ